MASSRKSQQNEAPSTYFAQGQSQKEESARLRFQDQVLTTIMGGVLSEQPDPARFQRVLDVGSGTGDWLIAMAKQYPSTSQLVGVDISTHMVSYARAQAAAGQVSDRVQFQQMDVLRRLDFPEQSFDLVNQRLGWSFLRTWEWPDLLSEYQRVSTLAGVIRVTEVDIVLGDPQATPILTRLMQLLLDAFFQAGRFFTAQDNGVSRHLARLLQQSGLREVQTRRYQPQYPGKSAEGLLLAENTKHLLRTVVPFLRKWTVIPDDYEALVQQALSEMQQPDFVASWSLLTAWGTSPGYDLRRKE